MSGIKNSNPVGNSKELFQTYNWYEKHEGQSLAVEPIVWQKREVFRACLERKRKVYRVEKHNRWHLIMNRTCSYVLLILKELSPGAAFKRSGRELVLWAKRNG